MFDIFETEKVIVICMLSFLLISITTRLLLGFLYQNMIKETDNMAATKNKLLKQCKLKFAHCYQLNNGVSNIPIFVEKFINRLSLGHISFETMYHLSGQIMLLSVVASGVGICKSIVKGRMLGQILPFYIISFFGLYLYFSIASVIDIKGKKRILKVNLIDYLENHLSSKIEITENDMELLYGKSLYLNEDSPKKTKRKKTVELMPIGSRLTIADNIRNVEESKKPEFDQKETETNPRISIDDLRFTKEQEIELEALLAEFLTS